MPSADPIQSATSAKAVTISPTHPASCALTPTASTAIHPYATTANPATTSQLEYAPYAHLAIQAASSATRPSASTARQASTCLLEPAHNAPMSTARSAVARLLASV